jgi:rRNA-processing protein CGR1
MSAEVAELAPVATAPVKAQGMRVNGQEQSLCAPKLPDSLLGKQWHEPKKAFRPKAGSSSYEKRQVERKAMATVKAKEKEMKEEKEAERQVSLWTEYTGKFPQVLMCGL